MCLEAKDRATQFKRELKELLKKYDTQIEMEEVDRTWAGCTYSMKVYLDAVYKNYECVAEFTEIDLGTYFDAD